MKKRFLAFLTALLLVLTSLFMTACNKSDDGNGDGEGESSTVNVETLSTKELFAHSIKNTMGDAESLENLDFNKVVETVNDAKTGKIDMSIALNEFEAQGQALPIDGPIKMQTSIAYDAANFAAKGEVALEILGEKPSASVIVSENGVYLTDILGINDKPIVVTYDDMGIDINEIKDQMNSAFDDALAELGLSKSDLEKIGDLGNFVVDTVENAIKANLTDDAYTVEEKDVTINGTEIKGAKVITLTITPAIAKGFMTSVLTDLLANDTIKTMLANAGAEEINVDEIMAEIDIESVFKSVKIVNTVDYDKVVGLDIDITAFEYDYSEDKNVEMTFAVRCALAGNAKKIQAGFLKDGSFDTEMGVLTVDYILNGSSEKLSISLEEFGEKVTPLTYEGTKNGNKHEGVINVDADGQKISVKGSVELSSSKVAFTVSEISVDMDGMVTTIPMAISVAYTFTDKKVGMEFAVKADIKDMAKIDMAMAVSFEMTNVSIDAAPNGAIGIDEIDEATAQKWLESLTNKYPKIFEFVNEMMTAQPDYGYDAEPDYDYGYGYDEEPDYDYGYGYDEEPDYDYGYGYDEEPDFGYGTGTVLPDNEF